MTQYTDILADPSHRIRVLHSGADTVWAQWLIAQAQDAGWNVESASTDPESGAGAAGLLDHLPDRAATVVLVISRAFVQHTARSPDESWPAAVEAAAARSIRLVAVIIGTAGIPDAAGSLPAVDLRAVSEQEAKEKFRRAIGGPDAPDGAAAPSLAGAAQVPVRYPGQTSRFTSRGVPEPQYEWFYGRERELSLMRAELDRTGRVVLCGMSSGGKTWLAAEYIRQYQSQYDLIAWIRSGQSAMLREDLGRLAGPLGIPDDTPLSERHTAVADALRNSTERFLLVFDDAVPDNHPRNKDEALVPGEMPALLSGLVPANGRGHVVYTSISDAWDAASRIRVQPFTEPESVAFLARHVPDLQSHLAVQYSSVVDGNPLALNVIAHVLSQGTAEPEALLELVRTDLAEALEESPASDYRPAHSIYIRAMNLLLADGGTDARLAVDLVRLLTAFAPEPVPIAMLTSQMIGTPRDPGGRLPKELAAALAQVQRRRAILEHITQLSLASLGTDQVSGRGQTLALHRLTRDVLRSQLSKSLLDRNAHIVHRLLCDADPGDPDQASWGPRYFQLWRQLSSSDALACRGVADPQDPCSQLPLLTGHIISALRIRGESTAAAELGSAALAAWTPLLSDGSIGLVLIRIELSNAQWQLARVQPALDYALLALRGAQANRDDYPTEYIRASNGVAAGMRSAGEWAGAVEFDRDAFRWAREALGPDDEDTIRAGHNYAVSLRMIGHFREALDTDLDTHARCLENPSLGERAVLALHAVNNIARDRREIGEYESSVRLQEQTLARFLELFGSPRQQHVLRARKNLAVSLRKAGDYRAALELARQVLADHLETYGSEHFESIAAQTNLANDCRTNRLFDAALHHASKAYAGARKLAPTHPFTAMCAVNMAAALRELDRNAEALQLDTVAVQALTAQLGDDHPYALAGATGLASDLAASGRLAEAAELGERTVARSREVRGSDHPYTLQGAANLTLDLRALGRTEEADLLERETLDRFAATLGQEHPEYCAAHDRIRSTCDLEPPPM